jgi:glycosyltransferase involved in cell wall biosynthesis
MDYFPNIDAVRFFSEQVLPRVRAAMPAVQFHIVGRNPSREVRTLHDPPHVLVTGAVPDVRPHLRKARIAVAPFRITRGIPNKILEAMAMGLPVVGTSRAFQGTYATESDGVRIVDQPQAFAETVCTLLRDGGAREECSYLARDYVERHHRWEDHGTRLDTVLATVA